MKNNKKQEELNNIKDEFARIQEMHSDLELEKYTNNNDLIEAEEIEMVDYDAYYDEALIEASRVLDSLVETYLGNNDVIKNNRYISEKVKDDSRIYADTIFLTKATKLQLKKQMIQIDSGDSSARMHEVVNQTIRETRENIEFQSKRKTEMEKYYKEFRKDLGLKDLEDENKSQEVDEADGNVINNSDMNEYIRRVMAGDIKSDD